MQDQELFDETNEATYCPEDDKIRLYVGRVPREEYLALRSEGWTSTPKQDCDFVAVWRPAREDTALSYAGYIGDEDQGPEDRAADRAERFTMYRDKRTNEAHGFADTFDAGPAVHGYQNQDKADGAAKRHNRQRDNALTQWSKAEYWQTRTAGVISNALYKSSASVRRGRVLKLEASARKDWISDRWEDHYTLRIAYENQMLESAGGSAACIEMVPGGFMGGYQVHRVHKSNVTKQVVSVSVMAPDGTFGYSWQRHNDGKSHIQKVNIQRCGEGIYREPTPEEMEDFKVVKAGLQAKTKKVNAGKPKLINPTLEDAQRLQDALNAKTQSDIDCRSGSFKRELKPSTVRQMTQAHYSANSKGDYAAFSAKFLREGAELARTQFGYAHQKTAARAVCKVRVGPSNNEPDGYGMYTANSVIVITDKPQKSLPSWEVSEVQAVSV
jgi:hypothetical protein